MDKRGIRFHLSNWCFRLSHFFRTVARALRGYEYKDEVHAAQRLRERYGMYDFFQVQQIVRSLVCNNKPSKKKRPLVRVEADLVLWEIKFRGKLLYPLFNHTANRIITFLTPEMAGRELAKHDMKFKRLQKKFNGS